MTDTLRVTISGNFPPGAIPEPITFGTANQLPYLNTPRSDTCVHQSGLPGRFRPGAKTLIVLSESKWRRPHDHAG